MCQRAGQDDRSTAWWTQPVSAAAAATFPRHLPGRDRYGRAATGR